MGALRNSDQAQRTLIVGLGETGLSVARFLSRQGQQVAITDSRAEPPGLERLRDELPDVGLFLGGFDEQVFAAADELVVSPGVSLRTPAIGQALDAGVSVIGDIELFARYANAPVVAITGSNGKSTVTTLLGEMAEQAGRRSAVGGNLGLPALDLLADDVELYVLELSSFQLETTHTLAPAVATVLNLSADHLDRYEGLDDYAAAKARIFARAAIGLINRQDARVAAMPVSGQRRSFGLDEPAGEQDYGLRLIDGADWLCRGGQPLVRATDLLLPGRHNLANALAALALGEAAGLPLEAMLAALCGFTGLPHRTQFVAEINGVRYFNDSKGTNVGACVAALNGLADNGPARTVLIAGGDCKDADFSELTEVVGRTCRAVVLLGRDRAQVEACLPQSLPRQSADDMRQAVQLARQLARPGDRVLLSPACASFDMFRGFAHRGEVFAQAVQELLA